MASADPDKHAPSAAAQAGRGEDDTPLHRQAARALEASGLAFFDYDLATGMVYLSEAWSEMLGAPRAPTLAPIGALFELVPEEDRPVLRRDYLAALKGVSREYRVDHRVRTPAGSVIWVSSWGRVVKRDVNGRALRMMGVVADVSAYKRAEQALRESEARFRSLTELSSDWYWEQDENFRFIEFSPEVVPRAGASIASHLGKARWELPWIGVSEERWHEHRARLEAHQPFRDFEFQRVNESGERIWISASGTPMFDDSGRFRGYRGIGRNVNTRKRAEEALRESEERFMAMFRNSPAPMALVEFDTQRVLDINDAHVQQLGRPRELVLGRTSKELDLFVDVKDREKIWEQLARTGQARMDAVPFQDASGALRWHMISARVLPDGEPKTVLVTAVDITGRIAAEQALRASETRFKAAFRNSAIGMALLAADGSWLMANEALCEILRYSEEELLQTDIRSVTYPEDRAEDFEFLRVRMVRGARGALQRERRLVRKDGTTVWVQIDLGVVVDGESDSFQVIAQIQDVTERRAAEARAEHLALHDPLTGLPNKRLLADRLAIALSVAKRAKTRVGAIFIDLDRFKPVNDTWGHLAGDAVLRQIAQRLQSALRQSDTVARVGGDEFLVLATGVEQRHELDRLVERLHTAIERPCEIESGATTVSASIGLAIYPDHTKDPTELLRRADAAMYEVKRARRAR